MAKLPDNFVKAPAETSRVTTAKPAGKEVRRKARRGAAAEAAEHARSVLVRLSPEEHQALSAACEALAAAGETVTIEDMIRKVVERWIAATRAAAAPDASLPLPGPSAAPPRAVDAIRVQLRWLVEQPVRRWRALEQVLRRWSRALVA